MRAALRLGLTLAFAAMCHPLRGWAADNTCFFRVVSSQAVSIVHIDPSTGSLVWTNRTPGAATRVEAAIALSDAWFEAPFTAAFTASNGLTRATLPNMTPKAVAFFPQQTAAVFVTATNAFIHSQAAWTNLWHGQPSPAPPAPIGLTGAMILIAAGARTSGGYGIEIERVAVMCGHIVVDYIERIPDEGDFVLPVITFPLQIARCTIGPDERLLPCIWRRRVAGPPTVP